MGSGSRPALVPQGTSEKSSPAPERATSVSTPSPSAGTGTTTPAVTEKAPSLDMELSTPTSAPSIPPASPAAQALGPFPLDWPPPSSPIDLAQQDLPHASSGVEWWYFHAHLTSTEGNPFALFGSFFRVVIGRSEKDGSPVYGHFLTWALTDPTARKSYPTSEVETSILPLLLSRLERGEGSKDPRIRRALAESLRKGKMPRPDGTLSTPLNVATDQLNLQYGTSQYVKDHAGDYHAVLHGKEAHSELTLHPLMEPHRHGREGVVPGKEGEEMFYYFIPRMAVTGTVTVEGKTHQVSGSGWYDHEFGSPRVRKSDDLGKVEVAWNWAGIQLHDGTSLTIFELQEIKSGRDAGSTAVIIHPDGREERSTHITLEALRWWRGVRSFESHPTAYALKVPDLKIDIVVEAVVEDQEIITVLSKPAFWEGQCTVRGTIAGHAVGGKAYFERSGFSFLDSLDDFFKAVSEEVRKSVASLLPLHPSRKEAAALFATPEHAHLLDGLDGEDIAQGLIAPIRTITDRGGKAWRSYAALACTEALGADCRPYVRWLSLPEIMHSGSLMVDDVEDRSLVRRGGPPAHLLFGEALTINAGTAAYFIAEGTAMKSDASDAKQIRLYKLYFEGLRAGHAGQALDIMGFDRYLDDLAKTGDGAALEQRILGMYRLKTGAPAGILARMGAVAADGTPQQVEGLGRFFENLGVAFQVIDDVLNLRGFKGDLKSVGEDLASGKVTLPVVRALCKLPAEERFQMVAALRKRPLDPVTIFGLIGMIQGTGAFEYCISVSERLVEDSWNDIEPLLPESLWKVMLRAFCGYVLERHY